MAVHTSLKNLFQDIADAIRAKDKSSEQIVADDFPDRIAAINTDPSQDATLTSGNQMLSPYTAYSKGTKYTGTIETKTDSGNVTLNASTTSKSYPAGYYPNAHGATHSTVSRASTTLTASADTTNARLTMSAGNNLGTGFVTGSDSTASKTVTLTANGATVTASTNDSNPVTVSKSVATGKLSASGTASATTTVAPGNVTIAKTSDGNASTGTVTTTKPSSGYYVAAKATAAANSTGATSSISGTATAGVTTAGYVSSGTTGSVTGTATAKTSAKDSSVTYIPLTKGALSASDSTISGGSFTPTLTYNSSSANFTFGGSKNATGTAYAKASTAGYVTSTENTSKSLSAAVSATGSVSKVGTGVTISGATTMAPTLVRTAKPSSDAWTDAASGAATTTKPTSGVYVQIDAAANTGTLTATPKVTSAGYGTTTSGQYGATAATATVGAAKATTAYVPIKTGSATISETTKQQSTPSISIDSSGKITASVAATSVSVTPTVSAGYITGGTAGTVTMSANSNTYQMTTQAAKTVTPSTSSQTAVASGVYTTGAVTVGAIQTEEKTVAGNGVVTPSSGKYLSKVTISIPTQGGYTVTPGTSLKLAVASMRLTTGDIYVAGDANLVAANIVSGKSIFGVSGSAPRGFARLNGNDFTGQKEFGGSPYLGTKYYKRITGHGFTPSFGGTYPTSNMVMVTGSNYITLNNWYPISGDWSSTAIDLPFNVSVSSGSAIWSVVGYY